MDRSSGDSPTPPFKWLKVTLVAEIKNVERTETVPCLVCYRSLNRFAPFETNALRQKNSCIKGMLQGGLVHRKG